ncbi:MAG: glutamine synthetase, partial [Proteobacteria bacterium]|nr:glutamine synthetase [Pseudomonadota bacterium]
QAIIIAAGLSGVKTNADPGPYSDIDMYAEGHTITNAPKLPLNLLDALRAYEADTELQQALGTSFSKAYLKLKHNEWNTYCAQFTSWEAATTLDI